MFVVATPFFFLLTIDWIKRQTTEKNKDCIQWTLVTRLEELNLGDDVALFSHNYQDKHSKLTRMGMISARAALRINKSKTKGMRINIANADRLELDGEEIDEVEYFAHPGINISREGGSDGDIQLGIEKAKVLSRF